MSGVRLAVWGDPIDHSKSPLLHAAAYRALGLDWEYGRRQVDAGSFPAAIHGLDDSWRGLSLTMPLKEQAFRVAKTHDRHAELTGAVNTLLLGESFAGFNTDVGGIIDAFAEHDVRSASRARILGAGATAASALVAVAEMGAQHVDVRARRPERALPMQSLGERLGVEVAVNGFADPVAAVDVTVATLPGGAMLDTAAAFATDGGTLLDVAYAPWPSTLAAAWPNEQVISGVAMLLHQAVRQVRVFVHGDPADELEDEAGVLAAMRTALTHPAQH
ncbi:shikimate dehydrogenase family protein [Microbacterium murale]|uniref:Shikimate 5-dehydrogenase n=1 Tax=Microbacterium murale TaxID=1081040 RepID=A0ABQ1RSV9_9MICO|nr:shikimate dehydrogenase [Microbacterium murale]GGD78359.1 shikimate 5-dehydrogenase [Microbacterium murale]